MAVTTPLADQIPCPLCGGVSSHLVEEIFYEDIRFIYHRLFDVAIPQEPVETIQFLSCAGCDLRFFYPQVSGDGAFYERLQQFPWYYLEDKPEYQLASEFASPGQDVLEIGCGAGNFAKFLHTECNYRGLEFNQAAIDKARARGLAVEGLSVEQLAESEGTRFDRVFSFQVLEHVAAPAEFLKAATKLLKPGGLLVISVPSEESFLADEVNNGFNLPPHHLTRWSDLALNNAAKVTGLELTHLVHDSLEGYHHRAFVQARLYKLAATKLGVKVPMVSRIMAGKLQRAAMFCLSLPLLGYYRGKSALIHGHSVTVVLRKSES